MPEQTAQTTQKRTVHTQTCDHGFHACCILSSNFRPQSAPLSAASHTNCWNHQGFPIGIYGSTKLNHATPICFSITTLKPLRCAKLCLRRTISRVETKHSWHVSEEAEAVHCHTVCVWQSLIKNQAFLYLQAHFLWTMEHLRPDSPFYLHISQIQLYFCVIFVKTHTQIWLHH